MMLPAANFVYPQNTTVEGDKMLIVPFVDGATALPHLYIMPHSRSELMRMLLV